MPKPYTLVRAHFEQLETIRQCEEWGWVEEGFRNLIENPTKQTASDIYESLIAQWFSENERDYSSIPLPAWAKTIASQYGIDIGGSNHGE